MIRKLLKDSTLYTSVFAFNAATSFFLIPVFTRFLTPAEYGIVSVVISFGSVCTSLLTLNLQGACTRFYYDEKDNPDGLAKLWGTNVTFILSLFIPFAVLFYFLGRRYSGFILGDIPFYPYVALGLVIIMTMPLFDIYQTSLKLRLKAFTFSIQQIGKILCYVALSLIFVAALGMKAEGILLGQAITCSAFFILSLIAFGKTLKWGIDKTYLKKSLAYSLPFMPARFSDWIMASSDRVLLNRIDSTAAVGIYSVGASFGLAMNLITSGFNEAFTPTLLLALRNDDRHAQEQFKTVALAATALFAFAALCLSLFSPEIITLLTTPRYAEAWQVIPFIAFANVMTGLDRMFRVPMEYNLKSGKFVSIIVVASAITHATLMFILIPRYGFLGIGAALLITNFFMAISYAVIGSRLNPFRWPYAKLALLVAVPLLVGLAHSYAEIARHTHFGFAPKILFLALMGFGLLWIASGNWEGVKTNYGLALRLAREVRAKLRRY